jgi:hypothetical protein
MFLSESITRAIHADRVREIERTIRERRLIKAAADQSVDVQSEAIVRGVPGPTASSRRMASQPDRQAGTGASRAADVSCASRPAGAWA